MTTTENLGPTISIDGVPSTKVPTEQLDAAIAVLQLQKRINARKLLDGQTALKDDAEFTPSMAEAAITFLNIAFHTNEGTPSRPGYTVQKGMTFSDIEARLRLTENEEKLKAVYRMIQANSYPTVVCEENGRFCIVETFSSVLPERANCVYDSEAEQAVGSENCNGNAVDQAKAMGISLMERRIAEAHMVSFSDKGNECYDYIQATAEERQRDLAPYLYRYCGASLVYLNGARDHHSFQGWRGQLWV